MSLSRSIKVKELVTETSNFVQSDSGVLAVVHLDKSDLVDKSHGLSNGLVTSLYVIVGRLGGGCITNYLVLLGVSLLERSLIFRRGLALVPWVRCVSCGPCGS